jgi:ribosomal protein S18 acetylase RimI-like enzyme
MLVIRESNTEDHDDVWSIIKSVIAGGDTYVFDPNSTREKMIKFWFAPDKHTYVATDNNKIVGSFFIKDNQPDLGSHIANAGYMTSPEARGKGIGKAMGEFSLVEARRIGYKAMQFNIVIASNTAAVALWKKIGFDIIGEIPEAFNHKKLGITNAYIMYCKL